VNMLGESPSVYIFSLVYGSRFSIFDVGLAFVGIDLL